MKTLENQYELVEKHTALKALLNAATNDYIKLTKRETKKLILSFIRCSMEISFYKKDQIKMYIKKMTKGIKDWNEAGRFMLNKFEDIYVSPYQLGIA